MRSSIKTKLALLFAVVLWASAFVGIRAGLHDYSPGALGLLRFLVASICMVFVCLRLPERKTIIFRDKILLLLVGMFGLGCYNIALNYGEMVIPSGISSFIISLAPILTVVLAILFLKESLTVGMIVGMVISLVGVTLIMLGETSHFSFQMGLCNIFAAAIICGFYSVMQKPFLQKYHAIEVTAYIIWGAALLLSIFTPTMLHQMKSASVDSTLSVAYLGVFPAALGYIAWSYGLREIPASRAINFLYFMPVLATLLGWLWLGEVPAWLSLLGGMIALFGVWVVNRSKWNVAK